MDGCKCREKYSHEQFQIRNLCHDMSSYTRPRGRVTPRGYKPPQMSVLGEKLDVAFNNTNLSREKMSDGKNQVLEILTVRRPLTSHLNFNNALHLQFLEIAGT